MRRERVLAALTALCREAYGDTASAAKQRLGFTTDEVALRAAILRNNCSAELNTLLRDGLVVKDKGRPTRYLVAAYADRGSTMSESPLRLGTELRRQTAMPEHSSSRVIPAHFNWGAGSEGSLHDAVQQAQVALNYPPHGMHTLLLGETGVGKSTFARKMHAYAVASGTLPSAANFVAFNCAEYANNPEILLDQLFGHARGAYTGAAQDKLGLIENAHNGVLFLDEVHRLPPEGQEILFHLLDYGEFRRLGETQNTRRAQVLLVAATTEAPESALLSTFRRRIPVVIRIPPLRDWSIRDRYELLFQLCREEARILRRTIRLEAEALEKLLFGVLPANIGDLKNLLRLACARVYSLSTTSEEVVIRAEHVVLPPQASSFRVLRISEGIPDMTVPPQGGHATVPEVLTENAFYGKLDTLARVLQGLGFESEEIVGVIERELTRREDAAVMRRSEDELHRFVGDGFYTWMQRAWRTIEHRVPGAYRDMAFARVAMHLFGLAKMGVELTARPLPPFAERVQAEHPEFYSLAADLLRAFTVESGIRLSEQEKAFVALLLGPGANEPHRQIGMVVMMYGEAVAAQIVETATAVAGHAPIVAVDVPLQSAPAWIDECCAQAIAEVNQGEGVLVMTDIPILVGLEERRQVEASLCWYLRPDTRSVALGIASSRMPMDMLRGRLAQSARAAGLATAGQPPERRVVWSCCLTGKGTAHAVKRLLLDAIPTDLAQYVEIIPKELSRQANDDAHPEPGLIAAVGSIDPAIPGVPFFSVEELLGGDGMARLINLLYWGEGENPFLKALQTANLEPLAPSDNQVESHVRRLLERDLVYVNPALVLEVCREMIDDMEQYAGIPYRTERYARFCLHTAFMIERIIQGDAMMHPYAQELAILHPKEWGVMNEAWKRLESRFRMPPNQHEMAYLFELFFSENLTERVRKGVR